MKKLFILISILWSVCSFGQNLPPESLWILKSKRSNIFLDFEKGYNAFYLDSVPQLEKKADSSFRYFKTNSKVLFLHNKGEEEDSKIFPDSLNFSDNLFDPSDEIQLFLISKSQFDHIRIHDDSISENTICKDFNMIVTDSLKSRKAIEDFFDNLLYKKGVVPDVISSPYIADIEYLRNYYKKEPVYRARVLYNGEELHKVNWKEFPHLKTCGVFRTSNSTLSPQKRGFMFSPDIYNFTDKNTKISGPKTFRAIKYELNEKLRYSMPLNGDLTNLADPEDKSTSTDIQFIKDPERGEKVAYFNGTSSYIDIRSAPEDELEEISLSAWVKPEEVDGSFSLIGKGEAFSAKIYYGRLQFTATGIKDHATSKRIINKNEWSHIAYVYVPRQKLFFYLNGELIEEISASDMQKTDHALLIGTNLWGQYYSGLLSDLKIWDRALSDDEVSSIYLNKDERTETEFDLSDYGIWLFLTLFLTGVLIYKKNKEVPGTILTTNINKTPEFKRDFGKNRITLLNGFKVWNFLGEDITYRFSPKRTELLILILLYTIKEGGITSRKMSETLWPGFTPKSQKNNRSTQIQELRKILEKEVSVEIVFNDKKWQLKAPRTVEIDIFRLHEIIPGFLSIGKSEVQNKTKILDFSQIVSQGPLLPQLELEWLDKIKSEYNNAVLDLLTPMVEDSGNLSNSERLEVINAVLVIDPLYEIAVRKKVECLLKDGKHMSVKKVVEDYKKLYESFYGEPTNVDLLKKG